MKKVKITAIRKTCYPDLMEQYENPMEHACDMEVGMVFTANGWEGVPHECDEGELAWIKKEKLLSLPLWEGDKIFLRLLDTDAPFFSLKLKYEGETLVLAVLNGEKIV